MIVHLVNDGAEQSWVLFVDATKTDDLLKLAIEKFSEHCRDIVEDGAIDMNRFHIIHYDAEYICIK